MFNSQAVKVEDVKELQKIDVKSEAMEAGKELFKGYFDLKPTMWQEIKNGISVIYNNSLYNQDILVIAIQRHLEIYINKDLNIMFAYVKANGVWKELDKEQATKELCKIYKALGAEQLIKRKESNMQSKYNLIGYLLKYKFNYKSFISWEKTINNFICFNFINEEGYNRSWITDKKSIIEYLNYNNADIKKVLFYNNTDVKKALFDL